MKWLMSSFASLLICGMPVSAFSEGVPASLTNIEGSVFVKDADGSKRVSGSANLKEGVQVFVTEDSSARLVYANGCEVDLAPSSVTYVSKEPVCDFKMKSKETRAQTADDDDNSTGGEDPDNTALIVGGTVVVVGGVAILVATSGGGGGDGPASP